MIGSIVLTLAAATLALDQPAPVRPPPKLRALLRDLGSEDEHVRRKAIETLHRDGRERLEAIPWLSEILKTDKDDDSRWRAAAALGEIGDPRAIPVLLRAARADPSEAVRGTAILSLGCFGPAGAEAVPTLITILKGSPPLSPLAGQALARIGPPSVPLLAKAVSDRHYRGRVEAAAVLGWLGKDAADGVPALISCLSSPDVELRLSVLVALPEIGVPRDRIVRALEKRLLKDSDERVRREAADAIASFGAQAQGSEAILCEALRDQSGIVRVAVASALQRVEPGNQQILPALLSALADQKSDARVYAAATLGDLGERAAAAVGGLAQSLSDTDWEVRATAANAIGRIGQRLPGAIEALEIARRDSDARVRKAAVSALNCLNERP